MTDVPYNQRCRIATPNYFWEGIFRPLNVTPLCDPAEAIYIIEVVAMTTPAEIPPKYHPNPFPTRVASFLYYSAGHPSLQIYDLDRLELNRSLVAVPTFNADNEPASFPLYRTEALLAHARLWWAGVKGQNSVVSLADGSP